MNQQEVLQLIGRKSILFENDLAEHSSKINSEVSGASFLVIGGAGSIGRAVVKELFSRGPQRLYVVDTSENNLAELVRDLRSSLGYIKGDFRTYCMDALSPEFDAFCSQQGPFDYVLNFSALKHVRSEKDPYTLMRMIRTNIFLTKKALGYAEKFGSKKFFCVSTDKASNPANMMGASKRIMELFLLNYARVPVSSARFANVAFSDGSLLCSFRNRLEANQPLAGPNDIQRYFLTVEEAAVLCLLSIFLGDNHEIFFPKLDTGISLESFDNIAYRFLRLNNLEPVDFDSEEEARASVAELRSQGKWPCHFSGSSTTGEKPVEEFYSDSELVDWERFGDIGIVNNDHKVDSGEIEAFCEQIESCLAAGNWDKPMLVNLFSRLLPSFDHVEKNQNLDQKM